MQKLYEIYTNLKLRSKSANNNFAILKLAVLDSELKYAYQKKIELHNKNFETQEFADSGFDIMVPENHTFDKGFDSKFIDMKVKGELVYCNTKTDALSFSPFQLYPRSSISKTPLMLANHVGIIDSGYRGNLIGAFRSFQTNKSYTVAKFTRLLQVCHPSLCPIYVILVEESDLVDTERGSGGFGSTGV